MKRLMWSCLLVLLVLGAWALPVDKNDWEEVNFVFNSSVLVDGFPSMLEVADLLSKSPDLHLLVEGHCDVVGSDRYNDQLAIKRATAVRDFLVKYGARPDQVEVTGKGKREPKAENETPEGRFINRRVVFTLYRMKDGVKEILKRDVPISGVIQQLQQDTCKDKLAELGQKQDAILNKLADLDKILGELQQLRDRQARLEDELARMRDQAQPVPPPLPPPVPVAPPALAEAPAAPLKMAWGDLGLLGFDLGATEDGDLTGSVSARYFHRFTPSLALQGQGEYLLYPERQEFQFDLGLVTRYKRFQAGAFASLKRVELDDYADGGTLAQGSVIAEYLFDWGSVGGFATQGLLGESVIDRDYISNHVFRETYLNTLNQYGVTAQIDLPARFMLEGNVGYIDRGELASRAGGLVRLLRPLGDNWSWFVEGSWNESLLGDETTGRYAAGLRYGAWKQPIRGEVAEVVPVDVPRLKYDVRTRMARTGNDMPIANAGPDQIDVPAGLIALDGTASYDPDGDAIAFHWTQVQGPAVSLSGANTATPSFTAESGHVYVFRLRVTDTGAAYAVDDVVVTTRKIENVEILFFLADPAVISPGQQSRLSWKVLHAESVEIEGIGPVSTEGTTYVAPAATQEYVLIARAPGQEVRATVVITIADAQILFFIAEPTQISPGQQSRLSWKVSNATAVRIEGIGAVQAEGSLMVAPTASTTYTLIATSSSGAEILAYAVVQVITPNSPPVAYAGSDQISRRLGTYSLDGSTSYDPDGDPLTFLWQQLDGPVVTLSAPTSAVTTFEVTVTGTYVFSLQVFDGKGGVASDTVRVTVY
ncbi:MAG TPA: OmpA family protein [Acidobacteriota bacterium]|nr:OmpA family protein [Acidobacteriota bacterium]HPB28138.1 OmpA family protein [Acidobacteriota bacterium]HQO26191.1 OmpA family protein [Acidobacteriota bacterium]HQP72890.1 OmpA family protein [Acidobacteriota bacterium]